MANENAVTGKIQTLTHPEIQRIGTAIEAAVAGMSAEQLAWAPQGKWSAANILEHLAITYGGTARVMRKVAQNGTSLASRPTAYQRVATFLVTGIGFLPGGRKAPVMTVPTGMDADTALATVRKNLAEMDEAFALVSGVGKGKIADHPVLGALTLAQWKKFHWVHTRHHMKQIAALREQLRVASSE